MPKIVYPQISIKFFTKKLLEHTSKSLKLNQKVIMGLISDVFKEYPLVLSIEGFALFEDEAFFEVERQKERDTHGSRAINVRVSDDSKIVIKEWSEKSGIPIWLLADHGLRLTIKYECLSGNNKWRKKIRDAIKRQSLQTQTEDLNGVVQWEKVHKMRSRALRAEEAKIIETVPSLRPIARDRVKPKRMKGRRKIKLKLEVKSVNNGVRYALDNYNDWYNKNIVEVKQFINRILLNRNPVTKEVIRKQVLDVTSQNYLLGKYVSPYFYGTNKVKVSKAQDCYRAIGKEWSFPDWLMWFERLVSLWESTHPYRKIEIADLSVEEWFTKYGLELPPVLGEISNEVILNYAELKRTGIISDIDLKVKKYLGIENRIEWAYNNFDELDPLEKAEVSNLVNSSEGYYQQYAQLLREKLKRDREKRDKGSQPP